MPSLPEHRARDLYLDLLKKSLTGTLAAAEPDAEQASDVRFVAEFMRHYIKGEAVTMLPLVRLDSLQALILDVIERDVPGDLIETGVWRGGATIFMRGVLAASGVGDRTVWVADSFEGLPAPDAERFPLEAKVHAGAVLKAYGHFAAGLDAVRQNFDRYGLLDDQVRFLPGWFRDTLPTAPIERLAILRLDGDYYESTWDALDALYDRLSIGGYVIVDDYGEDDWTYCRQAVEAFRDARGITDPLVQVDRRCWYWQRRAASGA